MNDESQDAVQETSLRAWLHLIATLAFRAAVQHLPPRQRALLQRRKDADERGDLDAPAAMPAEHARQTMPPAPAVTEVTAFGPEVFASPGLPARL